MEESTFKVTGNEIVSIVSDGTNKSVLKIDKHGVIHISAEKITVCEGAE